MQLRGSIMTYVDQAFKVAIQPIVAKALKTGRTQGELISYKGPMWVEVNRPALEEPTNILSARVYLAGDCPVDQVQAGRVLLGFFQADGRQSEQMLLLDGSPTFNGRRRWQAKCPCRHELASTFYLAPNAQQFMSRQAAGLKYRPYRRSNAGHNTDRMRAIMRKLGVDYYGAGMFKPWGMSEAQFEQLTKELDRANGRRLHMIMGFEEPDVGDVDVLDRGDKTPKSRATPFRTVALNDPKSGQMYFRDKAGTLQIKKSYTKKYGLPDGSWPVRPANEQESCSQKTGVEFKSERYYHRERG
jgi:hypothetical protein